MRSHRYNLCVAVCIVLMSACSGGNSVPPNGTREPARNVSVPPNLVPLHVAPHRTPQPSSIYTPLPADVHLGRAHVPGPFNPAGGLATLAQADLPNQAAGLAQEGRRFAQRFATAPPGDHEGEGVFMFGYAPPYNALFGTQTAYEAVQQPLTAPAGTTDFEEVFVPTMHPAWGSCLENSSRYTSWPDGSREADFTVFNFCESAPSFILATPIDRQFLQDYVRDLGDGLPAYVSEIATADSIPSGTSTWYSLLYNFRGHRYDVAASAPAIGFIDPGAFGWSVVEPYDAAGPCPQIAPAITTNLSVHNTSTGGWDAVTPTLAGGAYSYISVEGGSTNSCLLGDSSGSASMDFTLVTPNSEWEVSSPR